MLHQIMVATALFLHRVSFMMGDFGINQNMGDGFPDFTGAAKFFSKGLFNAGHLDVKRGPVKGDIGLVLKFSGITSRSPDNTTVSRPGQFVGQPVQPADHGAEKIQGAAAVLVKGTYHF